MSMTGGISFFKKSQCLFKDGASIVASNNNSDAKYVLTMNRVYGWESVGSNDTTTETLTITFPAARTINRLFLIGHNFKVFTVTYDTAQEFTGVQGFNNTPMTAINETDCQQITSYYEFDSITTDIITITVTATQDEDAEKLLVSCIATEEIGTLKGFPNVSSPKFDRNEQKQSLLSGLVDIVKGAETFEFSLDLSAYPLQQDVDLLQSLYDREDAFLVWLNGGKDQFKINQRGWNIGDIFQMQTQGTMTAAYTKNIYVSGVEKKLKFVEVA